jgi:hypothetical protein
MIDNQNKLLMLWEPYLCRKSLLGRIEGTWIVAAMCAHMNVQISYKYKESLLQCITKHAQLGMSVAYIVSPSPTPTPSDY